MNEQDLNDETSSQVDFESCLKRFRPSETSASISDAFYQAGWRAAVVSQGPSVTKSSRSQGAVFLSGAACGMLPMLILLVSHQASIEPDVSGPDLMQVVQVKPIDKVPTSIDGANRRASGDAEHARQPVAVMPSSINLIAEAFMFRSWFPQLKIRESSIVANSTLRFNPLTIEDLDLADINQMPSVSSTFLSPADDAAQSVDRREPLSAGSSALNEAYLQELFL